jgi:hypothetical protein
MPSRLWSPRAHRDPVCPSHPRSVSAPVLSLTRIYPHPPSRVSSQGFGRWRPTHPLKCSRCDVMARTATARLVPQSCLPSLVCVCVCPAVAPWSRHVALCPCREEFQQGVPAGGESGLGAVVPAGVSLGALRAQGGRQPVNEEWLMNEA